VIELLQIFLVAMESVNSLVMPDYLSDANSIAEINSPMLNIGTSSTPKKRKHFSQDVSISSFEFFLSKAYTAKLLCSSQSKQSLGANCSLFFINSSMKIVRGMLTMIGLGFPVGLFVYP
jgi:hypothetical protein